MLNQPRFFGLVVGLVSLSATFSPAFAAQEISGAEAKNESTIVVEVKFLKLQSPNEGTAEELPTPLQQAAAQIDPTRIQIRGGSAYGGSDQVPNSNLPAAALPIGLDSQASDLDSQLTMRLTEGEMVKLIEASNLNPTNLISQAPTISLLPDQPATVRDGTYRLFLTGVQPNSTQTNESQLQPVLKFFYEGSQVTLLIKPLAFGKFDLSVEYQFSRIDSVTNIPLPKTNLGSQLALQMPHLKVMRKHVRETLESKEHLLAVVERDLEPCPEKGTPVAGQTRIFRKTLDSTGPSWIVMAVSVRGYAETMTCLNK